MSDSISSGYVDVVVKSTSPEAKSNGSDGSDKTIRSPSPKQTKPTSEAEPDAGLDGQRTAFFYGTLMVPEILYRVCLRTQTPEPELTARYTVRPGLLADYSRRKVRDNDYPAIIPQAGASVIGTVVSGLNEMDIIRLDGFEGSMYERKKVRARVLEEQVWDGDGKIDEDAWQRLSGVAEGERKMVWAETYVWDLEWERLEEEEWTYEEFRRDKMKRWVDEDDNEEYDEEEDDYEWSGKKDEKEEEKEEEGSQESEESERKRIASVIARIAVLEEELEEEEKAAKKAL